MNKHAGAALALAAAVCLLSAALSGPVPGKAEENTQAEDILILVDGESRPLPEDGEEAGEDKDPGLRVTLTVDGKVVLELPFGEAHTVKVVQEGTGENTLILTGDMVYMEDADCPGHDCIFMGGVTADNLETRVMGGFIICLPHRLAVEVWEKK